jgi:DNA-binding response OmpR family regulator
MANCHQLITKEMLITKVWGYDSDAEDNNVEAYISFLRKKLNYLESNVIIEVLRKVGYSLKYEETDK